MQLPAWHSSDVRPDGPLFAQKSVQVGWISRNGPCIGVDDSAGKSPGNGGRAGWDASTKVQPPRAAEQRSSRHDRQVWNL